MPLSLFGISVSLLGIAFILISFTLLGIIFSILGVFSFISCFAGEVEKTKKMLNKFNIT